MQNTSVKNIFDGHM